MKHITVLEKYPVFTLEIEKDKIKQKTIDEILQHLKEKIDAHPVATYIATFDHYTHTSNLEEGEISDEILDAKSIICCFGKKLPKPEVLGVRPRAIGVAELKDRFVISFLEAPNPDASVDMQNWVKTLF